MKQSAAALVAACAPGRARPPADKADVLGDAAGEDNQILRHEGELPPEIGGIERRAGGRGEAGRFKIRFEQIASVSRPRLRRLAWCARRPDANAIAVARLSWTLKKHQSGEIDYTGRISKIGDGSLRTALYDAAHIILTKPLKGCSN